MSGESFVNIDSHAHLSSEELFPHADEIVKRSLASGVRGIVNINTDQETLRRGIDLQKKYPGIIFNTGSTTPHDVEEFGERDFTSFEEAAKRGDLVAIGETGLDYFHAQSKKEEQIKYLLKYIALAKEVELPVIFHCRGDDAFTDLFSIVKSLKCQKALLHCFTGTKEQAKTALDLGWNISISGIVTFKKSIDLQDVVKDLPLDRLFVETDAPYLAPQSKRGQVNEPSFLGETVKKIADLKKISPEEVATQTRKNICQFFKISCNMLKN